MSTDGVHGSPPSRGRQQMWRATVLTIFPEMFPGPLGASLAGKALAAGIWSLDAHDIRRARHRQPPHRRRHAGRRRPRHGDEGRRAGARASTRCRTTRRPRLLMSPRGVPLTRRASTALAKGAGVVVVCGRFEGVDERLIAARGLEEVSVGDYRAVRRRDRGAGADRRLRAAHSRRHGQGGLRRRGKLRRRIAGIPAIHPAGGVRGRADPRGADLRRPRQGQGLAAGRGRAADPRAPARPVGGLSRRAAKADRQDPQATGPPHTGERDNAIRLS